MVNCYSSIPGYVVFPDGYENRRGDVVLIENDLDVYEAVGAIQVTGTKERAEKTYSTIRRQVGRNMRYPLSASYH